MTMGKTKLSSAQHTILIIILLRNCSSVCSLARVIREVRRITVTEFYRIGEICGSHENGLLYGSENPTSKAREAKRIKAAEMKCVRKTAGYTWTDYKNTEIAMELNMSKF